MCNIGHSHNDFQKTVLTVHIRVSNLAKKIIQWKIFDVDGPIEISVEELFDKYYSYHDRRYKIPNFENCKRCNQHLQPFQFY